MTSLPETSTWPSWVVEDVDDFLGVLPNSSTDEIHSQMNYAEKNVPNMNISLYDNKDKENVNKYTFEIDNILSDWAQQDNQLIETSGQQLTESEQIDRMTDDEKIDYLADLMLEPEEPYQSKIQPQHQNHKGMNNSETYESNTTLTENLESKIVQNTIQCIDIKQLPITNSQNDENKWNSEFLNSILNNDIVSDKSISYLHHIDKNPNNENIVEQNLHQNKIPDQIINQEESKEQQFELQKQTISQNLQRELNSQQCSNQFQSENQEENVDIKIGNRIGNELTCSISQGDSRNNHMKVNFGNIQTIIKNTTPNKECKGIINKNIKNLYIVPEQKQVMKNVYIIRDSKNVLRLLQAKEKTFITQKRQIMHKVPTIKQKNTLQNQIKVPVINKEKVLSIQGGKLCMSSKADEVKHSKVEDTKPDTSWMKKRKKYEEDPLEDEEEERKRLQAKKAKNYRDKKKDELRIKDDQIKQFQEALQKCEREKNAYMDENKQLKEDIKKKDLLIQLYEGK
ncbi:unnamed protein product [Meganyctiphanes norvegica]|uniref:BZIP domain-containing protein n=1 Tax=Meganyctiphanes norvegica TaxID=48144 RepID=A0AAV2SCQ5_MEGNR